MPVQMTLTLTLDGVTYGELYDYVDTVRAAGVPAEEKVRCIGSDDKGDRFEVSIDPAQRRAGASKDAAGALTHSVADGDRVSSSSSTSGVVNVAETLRSMVRSEEDLDRMIGTLRDLRKFFR